MSVSALSSPVAFVTLTGVVDLERDLVLAATLSGEGDGTGVWDGEGDRTGVRDDGLDLGGGGDINGFCCLGVSTGRLPSMGRPLCTGRPPCKGRQLSTEVVSGSGVSEDFCVLEAGLGVIRDVLGIGLSTNGQSTACKSTGGTATAALQTGDL